MKKKTSPHEERVDLLARALAQICNPICDVGLGKIALGKLARHILKLRKPYDSK